MIKLKLLLGLSKQFYQIVLLEDLYYLDIHL